MAFFSKNGSGKQADSNRKRRHSLNAWLLYFGIASMGLTGVTFSKYSTTITGTITVQVAQAFTVTFLGYEKDETENRILSQNVRMRMSMKGNTLRRYRRCRIER